MFYIKDILKKEDNNPNDIYLLISHWDDFGYRTTFSVVIYKDNEYIDIGSVKITFKDDKDDNDNERFTFEHNVAYIYESLPTSFEKLPNEYISLGQDLNYYKNFKKHLNTKKLELLNDIIINKQYEQFLKKANYSFHKSLNRFFSTDIYKQISNYLENRDIFEEYEFKIYNYKNCDEMLFNANPKSILPSNVHAIIGSNGVGKTQLLENIVGSYNKDIYKDLGFIDCNFENSGFQRLVFITTSIFSKLNYLDDKLEYKYKFNYVGFNSDREKIINSIIKSIISCKLKGRDKLLFDSLEKISINNTIQETTDQLRRIFNNWHFKEPECIEESIKELVDKLSSGNMTILYIITSLIQLVEQKTLVLIDEPETHLHPTLLSALIVVINNIARLYNAIIIIATHSPVVLQEIPSNCIWKIFDTKIERPTINTFGENVGIITRDVYGLESEKSGFVKFIQEKNMKELREIKKQLGSEALFEFLSKEGDTNE